MSVLFGPPGAPPEAETWRQGVGLHQRVRARGGGRSFPLPEVGDGAVLTGDDDEPVRVGQPDRVAHHLQRPVDDRPVTPQDPPALGEVDALGTTAAVGKRPRSGCVVVHHHVAARAQFEHSVHQVLDVRRVPVRHEQVGEPRLALGLGGPRTRHEPTARVWPGRTPTHAPGPPPGLRSTSGAAPPPGAPWWTWQPPLMTLATPEPMIPYRDDVTTLVPATRAGRRRVGPFRLGV